MGTEMRCKHKAVRTDERGFSYCANPEDCDPRSHGGVCYIEICRCGATRRTNYNQDWEEEGLWCEPIDDDDE